MYRHREFPLFADGIECWQMQAFFDRVQYSVDSVNCQLAHAFNYICGCESRGYAGADTDAKRAALVWVPRISAILSILVSTLYFIAVLSSMPLSRHLSSGFIFHHL